LHVQIEGVQEAITLILVLGLVLLKHLGKNFLASHAPITEAPRNTLTIIF